jgi:hypothetical protein
VNKILATVNSNGDLQNFSQSILHNLLKVMDLKSVKQNRAAGTQQEGQNRVT